MTEGRTRPNSMRRLDNALRRMASSDKAYVNAKAIVANAIVCQLCRPTTR